MRDYRGQRLMIPILRQDHLIEFADGVLKLHDLEFQGFEASVCFAQVGIASVVLRMVDDGLTQIGI